MLLNRLSKSLALVFLTSVSSFVFADSAQYYVSSTGNDDSGDGSIANPWQSIQKALFTIPFEVDAVDINLRDGTYVVAAGGLFIDQQRGGSKDGTFRIRSYEGENAVVDGSLISDFGAMFSINSAEHVTLEGLEITNLVGNKSGIYISGSSSNISVYKNEIHDMHWTTDPTAAAAPTPVDNLNPLVVLGNSEEPMTKISIVDNDIYNLTTGYSEAVKIVGNVDGFFVEGNEVYDVANICIVAAGNYAWVGLADANLNHARNGIIRYNATYNCVSPIAASAGIYADGARDVFITENYSANNTVGFSVGSEQVGGASGIVLSRNEASGNTQAGIVIGTNTAGTTVSGVIITENELNDNYTDTVFGGAPIILTNAENITISDNKIYSINQYMVTASGMVTNLTMNRNRYESETVDSSAAVFAWGGTTGVDYASFEEYQTATGQDKLSNFGSLQRNRRSR